VVHHVPLEEARPLADVKVKVEHIHRVGHYENGAEEDFFVGVQPFDLLLHGPAGLIRVQAVVEEHHPFVFVERFYVLLETVARLEEAALGEALNVGERQVEVKRSRLAASKPLRGTPTTKSVAARYFAQVGNDASFKSSMER
jgi:hypothetical protein